MQDDHALIAAAKAGDQDAFTELYRKHAPTITRLLCGLSHHTDVDDLCQETFLKAFTRLDTFKGEASFSTWLYRIAANTFFMERRRTGARATVEPIEDEDGAPLQDIRFAVVDPEARSAHLRVDLEKWLDRLTPDKRLVVEMNYLLGMTGQEIADSLGVALSTAKSTKQRAKRQLQAMAKGSRLNYASIRPRSRSRLDNPVIARESGSARNLRHVAELSVCEAD